MKQFEELKLSEIIPNNINFRKKFDGPEFDDFVESVVKHGVIQPILVRPVGAKKEIVCGERRYRAANIASRKKGGSKTIPAVVRELSDDEMFDLMVIENLQREDLTELEEAEGFKAYLEKRGNEALVDLAERNRINAAYIRRRVSVLSLPQVVLDAWGEGEIAYWYLEQLARLDDEEEILGFFEAIMDGWQIESVRDFKRLIDNQAVRLDHAVFDLKGAGCVSCGSNSDTQIKLFEIDAEATLCLKPSCFLEQQTAWLAENWMGSDFMKEYKTSGFRFIDDVDHSQVNFFEDQDMIGEDCRACDAFITVFSGPQMQIFGGRVCIGESDCFKKHCAQKKREKSGSESGGGAEGQGGQPRVAWHGEYFREAFFKDAIPHRFEGLSTRGVKTVQLSLFALVKSHHELKRWLIGKYTGEELEDYVYPCDEQIFKIISEMDIRQASQALKDATLEVILHGDFLAEGRRFVAGHIGIDLSAEWVFTEEYLKKKTISEILGMGERFGIFSDPKPLDYLSETIRKRNFSKCKKSELIDVFIKSGVDLSGKVPDEILSS